MIGQIPIQKHLMYGVVSIILHRNIQVFVTGRTGKDPGSYIFNICRQLQIPEYLPDKFFFIITAFTQNPPVLINGDVIKFPGFYFKRRIIVFIHMADIEPVPCAYCFHRMNAAVEHQGTVKAVHPSFRILHRPPETFSEIRLV